MNMTPPVLPIKANEAAALADLVYRNLEGNPITADLRNRFAAHVPHLALETFTPYPGSLARDPIHPSTYYLMIDEQTPLLLRIALASSPVSDLFPQAMLIGRMRPGGGREIVINAVPFDFTDRENVRTFANLVEPAFLPRPQGPQSAIVVDFRGSLNDSPAALGRGAVEKSSPPQPSPDRQEGDLSKTFRAFRAVLNSTGLNLAAIAENYHIALWSAIRAGWREGWNAQTSDPSAPEYTKYSVEGSLDRLEEIYDRIRIAKAGRPFDFEISTSADIRTALDWMKSRGKPVQFIKVNASATLREQAGIAKQYDAILSFNDGDPEQIGIETAGRFHYRMRGGEEAIRMAASSLLGKTI